MLIDFGFFLLSSISIEILYRYCMCVCVLPLAMLHHGNVTYVRNAFKGTDCWRRCSFQKWNVCVNPRVVHNGLYAPSSNSILNIQHKRNK